MAKLNGADDWKEAEAMFENDLTLEQCSELQLWFEHLADVERLAVWCKLTSHGIDRIDHVKRVHRLFVKSVLDTFQVPMGDAGVGVIPVPRDKELRHMMYPTGHVARNGKCQIASCDLKNHPNWPTL